ncbi:MAG TPA: ABC transporter permease [Candidatus Udaeobacter sp.]|nr:ABC transporter permease [Candidatus Udaeobacter sp.]
MPDFKIEIKARLAELNFSPVREAEIVEELSQHLEEEYDRALSCGASEEQARQQALEQLNTPDLLRREPGRSEPRVSQQPTTAAAHGKINVFGDLMQDVRYALRMLAKNPAFTAIAVVALALGIGANSAIFSVVDAVLLRPLPFKNPQQLVMLWENAAHLGFPKNTPSPANFLDWQKQARSFTGMAATVERSFNLTGVGEPERLDGRRVSANLFDLLGVSALLGRTFVPEDDRPGAHVMLLSYSLWQRRFGSDPSVIGRALTLNGESYTVVGVMPQFVQLPGFENRNDQLWVPIAFPQDEAAQRGNHFLDVIARLKPDVTLKKAQAEMDTIAARLAQQYPDENTRIGAVVVPVHEQVVGDIKPALLVLLGAVAFVLLIACANVANLLLARAAVRQKEIALRLALGASRSRLTRQFLTESVVLAFFGAGLGLLLAIAGIHILRTFVPATISQVQTIGINGSVLIFTAAVAVLTGIAFGLAPAIHGSHLNLNDSLKEGGRDAAGGSKGNRARSVLVAGEVAVSFVLLIGAGLLINSFFHLRNLDPGFRADHLLAMKVDLSEVKYPDRERRAAFFDEVIRRVRALPGVQSAAVADNLPLTYDGDSMMISVEGIPDPPPDQRPDVIYRVIGPNYFRTMGIPIVRGRDFTDQDKVDSRDAVVISEKTARHFWPGEDPIGKRLKPGSSMSKAPWREVIGVVKDVRQNSLIAPAKMEMYFTYRQIKNVPANALVVQTAIEPMSLAASVRNTIWSVDKDQTVADIDTMDHIVAQAVARQRFSMVLLGLFAILALLLASVGIYGVMSYSVAQRTREIGIRIALGARRGDVLQMTVAQGLKLVGAGMLLGLIAAFLLTRVLATLLFGVSPTDPITFAGISMVLLTVAILASYVPALRATKVDPIIALRAQ